MEGEIMVVALTAIGCGTGIVVTFMNRVFGGKQRSLEQEARAQKDRASLLEMQVVEARRLNDQMQKQLEWHTKMLETQDRMMKQLTDGKTQTHAPSEAVSRS